MAAETLATVRGRPNCLNLLRLGFAFMVMAAHAWFLSGVRDTGPFLVGDMELGTLAVAGFFTLSGYLVTGSLLGSRSVGGYFRNRTLRVVPGFWVCILVTAFVLAPLSLLLGPGDYDLGEVGGFVLRGLALNDPGAIAGTLADHHSHRWNGSLWTVRFEVYCYVVLGVAAACGLLRRRWPVTLVTLAVIVLFLSHQADHVFGFNSTVAVLAHFWPLFGAGAVLQLFSDRIPLRADLAATSALALAAALAVMSDPTPAIAFPLAYVCLWVGHRFHGPRFVRENDLSYGVYIYAHPIQQVLLSARAATLGPAVFLALTVPVTLAFAFLSWRLVERPALARKSVRRDRPGSDVKRSPELEPAA